MEMMMLSAGLGALGSLFSGIMGFKAAKAKEEALRNAAKQANDEAGVQSQIELQQGDAAAAHGAVQAAANGGGFVGSSLGVISQLSSQALYRARVATYRGLTESQNDLYQSKVAGAEATNSLIGGVLGAAGGAAGGWAKSAANSQFLDAFKQNGGEMSYDSGSPAMGGF